jgi:hypothetical protein
MKNKGIDCVNNKAHCNRPAPSVLLARGIAGFYVCFFDGAGRDHLVLEDLGLVEQIQHQHQLSGTRHQQICVMRTANL